MTMPVPLGDAPSSCTIFVSYSHKDEDFRKRLHVELSQLVSQLNVALWDDRQILPGSVWDTQITNKLEQAEILLILLSPEFLASPQCMREARRALEIHKRDNRPLVPILLRPCDFEFSELAEFQ